MVVEVGIGLRKSRAVCREQEHRSIVEDKTQSKENLGVRRKRQELMELF